MPQIPNYDQRVSTPSAEMGGLAAPDSQVADATRQFGATLAMEANRFQDQVNEVATKRADVQYLQAQDAILNDPKTGYLNLKGEDALNALPHAQADLAKARTAVSGSLKNPVQQRNFALQADARDVAFRSDLNKHASGQFNVYQDGVSQDRIDISRRALVNSGDPDSPAGKEAATTLRGEYDAIARRKGLGPDYAANAYAAARSDALVGMVKGALDAPGGAARAQALLDAHGEEINLPERSALGEMARKQANGDDAWNIAGTLLASGSADAAPVEMSGNPVASDLIAGAKGAGADTADQAALVTFGKIESHLDPKARNGHSTGVLQFHPNTFSRVGGRDINSVQDQGAAGYALLKESRAGLQSALGRAPTYSELYLAHQQGLGAAKALLTAPPEVGAIAALEGAGIANARASILNNVATKDRAAAATWTAGQFAKYWNDRYSKAAVSGSAASAANPATRPATAPDYGHFIAQALAAAGDDPERQKTFVEAANARWSMQERAKTDADNQQDQAVAPYLDPVKHPEVTSSAQIPGFGTLKQSRQTEIDTMLVERNKKALAAAQQQARVDLALKGGLPLDPANTKDKEAVDGDFLARTPAMGTPGTPEFTAAAVAYASKVGMVPETYQGLVRGGLRSSKPEQVIASANAIQTLRAANPELIKDFSNEDTALANTVAELSVSGVDPVEAVQVAKDLGRISSNDLEARKQQYATATGKAAPAGTDAAYLAKAATAHLGEGWLMFKDAPRVAEQMQGDFSTMAKDFYARTGNIDAARKTAFDALMRVYGRSEVSGKPEVMKYPPEKFFGVPALGAKDNAGWMREQLMQDVFPHGPEKGDQVSLQLSYGLPFDRKNHLPVYGVKVLKADGSLHLMVNDKGAPVQWQPNWKTSPGHAAYERKMKDKVAAARREREARSDPGDIAPVEPGALALN